ncbi:MAG: excinuclease ABC subunit UvrB [Anaerolineales bacterium]
MDFQLQAPYRPMGDQPQAIKKLVKGVEQGQKHQVLLGATGTGKTYTIANVIQQLQMPALVIAHNKTLAAQLYAEFKSFFPQNAVEYFVSYYDYYQPEAYVPHQDLFIEKETDINEEIDRLRLAATTALMSRKDVIIVASVSCIYGLGNPEAYGKVVINLQAGSVYRPPAYDDQYIYRISFFGDEVEGITRIDRVTAEILEQIEEVNIYPAKHFITEEEKLKQAIKDIEDEMTDQVIYFNRMGKLLEAQRIEQRTKYDLEMLREVGYCSGIENYSRHLDQRPPNSPPWTMMDYLPQEYLLILDESHMTVPQIRGMYNGDRSRKATLAEYGFRLPSALDNRPLKFEEFEEKMGYTIYTSATPGPYELNKVDHVVDQVIRPTGLVDPEVVIRPIEGQIDDLMGEIYQRTERGERVLVTTLTKRMAEDLSKYLEESGVKVHYLHSEIDTLERVGILRDLRLGIYDVIVGINLLREGLDLPEVSLVAILDADKAGFLRSDTALIQTIGRAARHVHGMVIMYADEITPAMQTALEETDRRRQKQVQYNQEHGIEPESIKKSISDITERVKRHAVAEQGSDYKSGLEGIPTPELKNMIGELEKQMLAAAENLEFETAAGLRDQIFELREILALQTDMKPWEKINLLAGK